MRGWMVLAMASGLAIVACGDDDGGGGGSSIDGKKVSDLNEGEVRTLCEWFVDQDKKRNVSDEEFCTQDAAESAESTEECEEYRDECVAEIAAEGDPDCGEFDVSATCSVDVGALKKCISDVLDEFAEAARGSSCDNYEDAIVAPDPASCEDVPPSCIQIEISASTKSLSATSGWSRLRR
jgi:hypothetical protein